MKNTDLAFQLGTLFDSKIISYYRSSFRGFLGQIQIQLLSDLWEHQSSKLQDIAERLNISKQHASKILLHFEESGYVVHRGDQSDRRSKLFQLSSAGEDLVREHIEGSNRHFEEMLSKLDLSEQKEMTDAMKTLIRVLQKM